MEPHVICSAAAAIAQFAQQRFGDQLSQEQMVAALKVAAAGMEETRQADIAADLRANIRRKLG